MTDYPAGPGQRSTDLSRNLRLAALLAVIAGVVLLAVAAFLISYTGIHQIALQAGVASGLARLYPVIFDAMLVIASAAVLALRGAGWPSRVYIWLCLVALLAAVATGDAVHAMGVALPRQATRAGVAVTPWALVLLAFGLLLTMLHHLRRVRADFRARARAEVHANALATARPGNGALPVPRPGQPPALPAAPAARQDPAAEKAAAIRPENPAPAEPVSPAPAEPVPPAPAEPVPAAPAPAAAAEPVPPAPAGPVPAAPAPAAAADPAPGTPAGPVSASSTVPAAPLPAAEEQPERDQRAEEYPEHQPDEPAQEHGSGQQRDPAAPEDTAPVLDTEEYLGTEEYGDAAEHPETDEYHEQAPAMPEAGSALAYWFGKTHPATDPPWDGAADPQPATPAPLPHFDRLHSTPSRPHD